MKKKSFIGCLLAFSLLCMSGCGGGGDSQASSSNHREDKNYYFSFGVYGDPQVGADDSPQDYSVNSEKAIRMTMEYFQKEGMDAIVSVGDVIDYCEYNGLPGTAYDKFNEILDDVFGERNENGVRTEAPIMLHTLGNHEFSGFNHTDSASWYWDYSGEAAVNIFCEKLNTELIQVYENYGYTIITANMSECRGKFSDESKQKIEAALKTASADDPWRPIFVTTHYVPQDTVYHSDWISDDDAWLSNLLKQYPQVILFTGHTHNPLNDPRIISQKDYTVVNAGCNEYASLPEFSADGIKYDNVLNAVETDENNPNSFNADWCSVHHGLVVDVYGNRTVITRVDFETEKTFGEPIVIYKYQSKDDFDYVQYYDHAVQRYVVSEELKDLAAAPEFGKDAAAKASARFSEGTLTVTFKDAEIARKGNGRITLNDIVECYTIRAYSAADKLLEEKTYISRYWLNDDKDFNYTKRISMSETPAYVEIVPRNAYGMEGIVLRIEL